MKRKLGNRNEKRGNNPTVLVYHFLEVSFFVQTNEKMQYNVCYRPKAPPFLVKKKYGRRNEM